MKRLVSLKAQYAIMFIPYFNILNQFIFIHNCICVEESTTKLLKALPRQLLIVVGFALFYVAIEKLTPLDGNGQMALLYVIGYFCPLFLGWSQIEYQKRTFVF